MVRKVAPAASAVAATATERVPSTAEAHSARQRCTEATASSDGAGCQRGGPWVPAASGRVYPVLNPATGAHIIDVPDMDFDDTQSAIAAAKSSQLEWRLRTAKERSAIMRNMFEIMIDEKQQLAELLSEECGKPLAEALGEIAYGASFLEWYAEEGKRVYGDVIPPSTSDRRVVVVKQPVGVAA